MPTSVHVGCLIPVFINEILQKRMQRYVKSIHETEPVELNHSITAGVNIVNHVVNSQNCPTYDIQIARSRQTASLSLAEPRTQSTAEQANDPWHSKAERRNFQSSQVCSNLRRDVLNLC